jgi:hypothetical protein
MKKSLGTIIISAGLLVSPLFIGTVAHADLINFDDLSSWQSIASGYAGLNWNNFTVLHASGYSASGYVNGLVSPDNVAFNAFGTPASISDDLFTLNSAYMTAAWNDGLQVQVIGRFGGNTLYDNIYTLNTSGPVFINFNYVNVDEVDFISSGGVNHGYSGEGTHFAMDDLTINFPAGVPDAGSCAAMLGGGLALLVFLRRRITG